MVLLGMFGSLYQGNGTELRTWGLPPPPPAQWLGYEAAGRYVSLMLSTSVPVS